MPTEIQLLFLSLCFIYVIGQDLQLTGGNYDELCRQCSGPCKLSLERECQSYIQCDPGHPAKKMYCPFGTFFNGEMGCDRPSNTTCRADPCAVNRRNLKSYGAIEDKCNLFWKCVDGTSAPDCCLEGYAYDKIQRTCVVDDTCNDTCSMRGGQNHDNTRPKYRKILCEGEAAQISCGANEEIQINKMEWGRTDENTCKPLTPSPLCRPNDVKHLSNCDGSKVPCTLDANPNLYPDMCFGSSAYLDVEYECREGCYLVIKGNDVRNFYNRERMNSAMTCPPGTSFDPNSCVCVNSGQAGAVCMLEVHVTFDNKTKEVKNKMHVHISPHKIEKKSGFGQFNGQSVIEIPFYAENDRFSKKFGLQLRIFAINVDLPRQILLSNCELDKRDSASLEIHLVRRPDGNFTHFRVVRRDNNTVDMFIPILIKEWTNILFGYDGEFLYATLQYIDPVTGKKVEDKRQQRFEDTIRISKGAMNIGGCMERRRGGNIVYDGLYAFIDEIQMSFCKVALPTRV